MTAATTIAPDPEFIWRPRPTRRVPATRVQIGDVILGPYGGHATVLAVEGDGYITEHGPQINADPVLVAGDDDILGPDIRDLTDDELILMLADPDGNLDYWHYRVNQLLLWGVVSRVDDWDRIVGAATRSEDGADALGLLPHSLDFVRQAVEHALERHHRRNAQLGVGHRLYRSCPQAD